MIVEKIKLKLKVNKLNSYNTNAMSKIKNIEENVPSIVFFEFFQ
jgi:hypothetical protein